MQQKRDTMWWTLWVLLLLTGVVCSLSSSQRCNRDHLRRLRERYFELEREAPRTEAAAFLNLTLITSAVLLGLALIRKKRRGHILAQTAKVKTDWALSGLFFFFVLWFFYIGATVFITGRLGEDFGAVVLGDIAAKIMMLTAGFCLLAGQFGEVKKNLGLRGGTKSVLQGGYIALLSLAPVWVVFFVWSGFAERIWGRDVNILVAGFVGGLRGELPFWTLTAVVVLACVVGPLAEEFLFRVLLYPGLKVFGVVPALILQAGLFGLLHSPYEAVPIMALGFMLGYLYERSGSLYGVWTAHGLFNAYSLTLTWLQVR